MRMGLVWGPTFPPESSSISAEGMPGSHTGPSDLLVNAMLSKPIGTGLLDGKAIPAHGHIIIRGPIIIVAESSCRGGARATNRGFYPKIMRGIAAISASRSDGAFMVTLLDRLHTMARPAGSWTTLLPQWVR